METLKGQEKLDALYELKMALFVGQVLANPALTSDPLKVEIKHENPAQDA